MTTVPLSQVDNTNEDPHNRSPLILEHKDFGSVTDVILNVNESARAPKSWYFALAISFSLMSMLGVMIGYLFFTGVGVWGNNNNKAFKPHTDIY